MMFLIGENQVAFASAPGSAASAWNATSRGSLFRRRTKKSRVSRASCEFQAKRTWVMGFLWDFLEKLRIGPNPVLNRYIYRYIYSVEIVEMTMKFMMSFMGILPFSDTPRCRFIVPLQPMLSRQNYFITGGVPKVTARSIWSFPISHSKS